jgi:tRNA-specific 2-thiouridylase
VVENAQGERLGAHAGHFRFTVGQRRGLGIAAPDRLYVISIDPQANRVVVGGAGELETSATDVTSLRYFPGEAPGSPFRADVRVRHRAPEVPATVHPRGDGTAHVVFDRPVRAVAPGQSCVFYRGDDVVGGGVIARRREARENLESARG